MFSKVFGIGLSGIDAYEVSVEVDVSDGLPAFVMVGVLAAEVKEAQDRVRTALRNGGFTLRPQKVTVKFITGWSTGKVVLRLIWLLQPEY